MSALTGQVTSYWQKDPRLRGSAKQSRHRRIPHFLSKDHKTSHSFSVSVIPHWLVLPDYTLAVHTRGQDRPVRVCT
eukprot:226013-Rhodomonas_salina.3